ncbi:hypothetical protein BC827DRAFT_1154481 [Russula dissimulans]|nr:hypothetical protein BC827DRAFT_1154481 [Russula dissimulans]
MSNSDFSSPNTVKALSTSAKPAQHHDLFLLSQDHFPAHHPLLSEGEAFNFDDVYKVAWVVFTGNQFFPFQLQDRWNGAMNDRGIRGGSGRVMARWFGNEEDPREYEHGRREYEHEREHDPPYAEFRSRDGYGRRDGDPPRHFVRFKDQDKKDDDCELDDLMDKRNGLSLRERSYAALYAWLAHRFPNVAVYLPKPKPEVVS